MTKLQIPVTYVGSLVRPDPLLELLRRKRDAGDVSPADLAACLDTEVAAVVAKHAEVGIDIVSDGEFGKSVQPGMCRRNRYHWSQ